jgi:hypothetical protein
MKPANLRDSQRQWLEQDQTEFSAPAANSRQSARRVLDEEEPKPGDCQALQPRCCYAPQSKRLPSSCAEHAVGLSQHASYRKFYDHCPPKPVARNLIAACPHNLACFLAAGDAQHDISVTPTRAARMHAGAARTAHMEVFMTEIVATLTILVAAYGALVLYVFIGQGGKMYLPDLPTRELNASPADIDLPYDNVWLRTEDGLKPARLVRAGRA